MVVRHPQAVVGDALGRERGRRRALQHVVAVGPADELVGELLARLGDVHVGPVFLAGFRAVRAAPGLGGRRRVFGVEPDLEAYGDLGGRPARVIGLAHGRELPGQGGNGGLAFRRLSRLEPSREVVTGAGGLGHGGVLDGLAGHALHRRNGGSARGVERDHRLGRRPLGVVVGPACREALGHLRHLGVGSEVLAGVPAFQVIAHIGYLGEAPVSEVVSGQAFGLVRAVVCGLEHAQLVVGYGAAVAVQRHDGRPWRPLDVKRGGACAERGRHGGQRLARAGLVVVPAGLVAKQRGDGELQAVAVACSHRPVGLANDGLYGAAGKRLATLVHVAGLEGQGGGQRAPCSVVVDVGCGRRQLHALHLRAGRERAGRVGLFRTFHAKLAVCCRHCVGRSLGAFGIHAAVPAHELVAGLGRGLGQRDGACRVTLVHHVKLDAGGRALNEAAVEVHVALAVCGPDGGVGLAAHRVLGDVLGRGGIGVLYYVSALASRFGGPSGYAPVGHVAEAGPRCMACALGGLASGLAFAGAPHLVGEVFAGGRVGGLEGDGGGQRRPVRVVGGRSHRELAQAEHVGLSNVFRKLLASGQHALATVSSREPAVERPAVYLGHLGQRDVLSRGLAKLVSGADEVAGDGQVLFSRAFGRPCYVAAGVSEVLLAGVVVNVEHHRRRQPLPSGVDGGRPVGAVHVLRGDEFGHGAVVHLGLVPAGERVARALHVLSTGQAGGAVVGAVEDDGLACGGHRAAHGVERQHVAVGRPLGRVGLVAKRAYGAAHRVTVRVDPARQRVAGHRGRRRNQAVVDVHLNLARLLAVVEGAGLGVPRHRVHDGLPLRLEHHVAVQALYLPGGGVGRDGHLGVVHGALPALERVAGLVGQHVKRHGAVEVLAVIHGCGGKHVVAVHELHGVGKGGHPLCVVRHGVALEGACVHEAAVELQQLACTVVVGGPAVQLVYVAHHGAVKGKRGVAGVGVRLAGHAVPGLGLHKRGEVSAHVALVLVVQVERDLGSHRRPLRIQARGADLAVADGGHWECVHVRHGVVVSTGTEAHLLAPALGCGQARGLVVCTLRLEPAAERIAAAHGSGAVCAFALGRQHAVGHSGPRGRGCHVVAERVDELDLALVGQPCRVVGDVGLQRERAKRGDGALDRLACRGRLFGRVCRCLACEPAYEGIAVARDDRHGGVLGRSVRVALHYAVGQAVVVQRAAVRHEREGALVLLDPLRVVGNVVGREALVEQRGRHLCTVGVEPAHEHQVAALKRLGHRDSRQLVLNVVVHGAADGQRGVPVGGYSALHGALRVVQVERDVVGGKRPLRRQLRGACGEVVGQCGRRAVCAVDRVFYGDYLARCQLGVHHGPAYEVVAGLLRGDEAALVNGHVGLAHDVGHLGAALRVEREPCLGRIPSICEGHVVGEGSRWRLP